VAVDPNSKPRPVLES